MSDRIAELKHRRAALVAEMKAIVEKETDDKPMEDGDKTRFDEIKNSIDDHDQRIGRLESLVAAEGGEDQDGDKQFLDGMHKSNLLIQNKKNRSLEAKGTQAARFIIGAGMAKQHGLHAGVQYVRDNLDDAEVSKALNATGTSAAGGLLVPQGYRAEIIDLLWAEAVVRQSNPQVIPMPLGQLTMPRLSTASAASWIGEATAASVSTPSFDQIVMQARKLASIVPVQSDLVRRSPLAVESIVRTQMVKQMARAEDAAFLTGSGSGNVPKGLTNWALAANVSNMLTPAPTLSTVNNVLANAQLNLLANNVSTDRATWFMNPNIRSFLNTLTDSTGRYFFKDELDRGTLYGMPYKMTTILPSNLLTNGATVSSTTTALSSASTTMTLPTTGIFPGMQVTGTGIAAVTTVVSITDSTHMVVSPAVTVANSAVITASYVTSPLILADTSSILLGDTLEMFADSSDVASYFDGSNTISAFQSDQIVFRLIEEVDINVMHPAVISVVNVFNWLPSGAAVNASALYSTQTATYPASPSLSASPV